MKYFTALFISLFFSLSANATIIDNGTYTTDTDTGLDWLDLTETDNESFDDVSLRIASGGDLEGWTYATGAQWETLMTNFGAIPMSTPACTSAGIIYCGWSVDNDGLVRVILSYLGDLTGLDDSAGITADVASSGHQIATRMLDFPASTGADADYLYTLARYVAQSEATTNMGSLLIKTSEVPLPAAVWLFGSALLGLGVIKRKRS